MSMATLSGEKYPARIKYLNFRVYPGSIRGLSGSIRGLSEVRGHLRNQLPATGLAGFDEASEKK